MGCGGLEITKFWMTYNDEGQVKINLVIFIVLVNSAPAFSRALHGRLFDFFHGQQLFFHGCDFAKIFTEEICFPRPFFFQFSEIFTGAFFFSTSKTNVKKHSKKHRSRFFKFEDKSLKF